MLRYAISWLIPLFLIYMLLALLWNAIHGHARWDDAARGGAVFAMMLSAIVGYRIFRLRRAYRLSSMARHKQGIALAFNEEYFVSGLPEHSEGRFRWPALYDFAENGRVALLYTAKNRAIVIPKHAMPSAAWDVFRTLAPNRKGKPYAH